jgi:hypothetical protein
VRAYLSGGRLGYAKLWRTKDSSAHEQSAGGLHWCETLRRRTAGLGSTCNAQFGCADRTA